MNQLEGIILMSQQEKHGVTHGHSDLDMLVYYMYNIYIYTIISILFYTDIIFNKVHFIISYHII